MEQVRAEVSSVAAHQERIESALEEGNRSLAQAAAHFYPNAAVSHPKRWVDQTLVTPSGMEWLRRCVIPVLNDPQAKDFL